jgi:hypothetical protein
MIKHTIIALIIQATFYLFPAHPLLYGALAGSLFFFSRELAQAEYRWMKANNKTRDSSPWYNGFYPSAWNKKSVFDWVIPTLVVGGIYFYIQFINTGDLGG